MLKRLTCFKSTRSVRNKSFLNRGREREREAEIYSTRTLVFCCLQSVDQSDTTDCMLAFFFKFKLNRSHRNNNNKLIMLPLSSNLLLSIVG